ncbi:lipopolysaccharide transport system permease protein [Tahibacter aquaticus]|uniref:Transport permease protein n=1 Tax=Tahibacter aquaticus TaxID=520092 RepID=A0A4R6YUZ8_9GAMM|nr:ABC transporter permease [Tahibacter aquaticus]TDR42477.1 lipopolysaccharide transport system permease protein [Tahibacter aquaticus]
MRLHFLELVWFSTYAELRAERSRSYLGLLWWLVEPALMMVAFWLVFDRILGTGGPGYLPFLLIGLVIWQWLKSSIVHAGHAIWMNLALVRQVRLPVLLFPLVALLTDSIKFGVVFLLLLAVLWLAGYPPNAAYLSLPLLLLGIGTCAAGCGLLLAALMPLLPDLRFVIEQLLTVLMFLSGVVFALQRVPQPYADWLAWNPVMVLLDAVRGVLLQGAWPDGSALVRIALPLLALAMAGLLGLRWLAPRYPKIAA